MKTVLVRRAFFQCVHRYEIESWSKDQNIETFGLCFNKDGHGHDYTVDAYVEGNVDVRTGMVINLRELDSHLKLVIDQLANRHLNLEVEEFKKNVPTTENIARFIFTRLKSSLKAHNCTLKQIRVYESDDLWVDYSE